ncbi:NADPH-dependent diflavin oxidoreductase 1 isoform X2 [Amborella trichopoda]|uniref:NADPH-dependent diflavin oxidoreductase 1 isoform X2 n=1 Tax=Amborella trichopoda TaxID=13333 RepID=UPI0009BF5F92|nr:NADPH-dependent diflavin oxidoreductase 1 isoform X2 [Amborella trichopoda]|eukprot:XP_020520711.1 NADPH-dependent diflavin oxidoreductase 1 isoform X2 [Amborella trichopoda]
MEKKPQRLLILYASQTGNALDVAEHVEREAGRRHCPAIVLSTDQFDARELPSEGTVCFIVSTTGQGDTPDSMKEFWRSLLQRNLSHQWLEGVYYAVFGLGDSGYQKYNVVAKKLDKRLTDLGAKPIIGKGLGDEQHPSGYEGDLDPWLSSFWVTLKKMHPSIFTCDTQLFDPNMKVLDYPKFQIIYHDVEKAPSYVSRNIDLNLMEIESVRTMTPGKFPHHDCRRQCFVNMAKNVRLTNEDGDRDVRLFEFNILSSDTEYEVGDVLEILPCQNPAAVNAFLQRCNLDPESYISVMSFFATAEHEKERLQYFASPEGRDDLYQYNQKERRTVLEVLEDFPSVQMPFEWFVQLVPPLKTRLFSISSSPLAHPDQIHLTVAVVAWTTPFKRKRHGLCSTWLAGLDPQKETRIPAWIQRGSLRRPSPSLPLILIGPGTGCAPFRAFVEERALQSTQGPVAPVIFFFGCRNQEKDFLYKDSWLSHCENSGVLSEEKGGGFFVAFSRDQLQKVYVQHKMREQSQRIWELLGEGGAVYIAGSATKMPADVMLALEEIITKEGGTPMESATRLIRQLEKVGRYNVEAWS